jgi:hypothetical protein
MRILIRSILLFCPGNRLEVLKGTERPVSAGKTNQRNKCSPLGNALSDTHTDTDIAYSTGQRFTPFENVLLQIPFHVNSRKTSPINCMLRRQPRPFVTLLLVPLIIRCGRFIMLDVTRNYLLFLKCDRQLPGQADQRLRIR